MEKEIRAEAEEPERHEAASRPVPAARDEVEKEPEAEPENRVARAGEQQQTVERIARLVEKTPAQLPHLRVLPEKFIFRKLCARRQRGQAVHALRQDAVFRLQSVVAKMVVGITGGDVGEFIRRVTPLRRRRQGLPD